MPRQLELHLGAAARRRGDDGPPAVALHAAKDGLAYAEAVLRHGVEVEPGAAVADEHLRALPLDLAEHADRLAASVLGGVEGRLARRLQQRAQALVERGVPDRHHLDLD